MRVCIAIACKCSRQTWRCLNARWMIGRFNLPRIVWESWEKSWRNSLSHRRSGVRSGHWPRRGVRPYAKSSITTICPCDTRPDARVGLIRWCWRKQTPCSNGRPQSVANGRMIWRGCGKWRPALPSEREAEAYSVLGCSPFANNLPGPMTVHAAGCAPKGERQKFLLQAFAPQRRGRPTRGDGNSDIDVRQPRYGQAGGGSLGQAFRVWLIGMPREQAVASGQGVARADCAGPSEVEHAFLDHAEQIARHCGAGGEFGQCSRGVPDRLCSGMCRMHGQLQSI